MILLTHACMRLHVSTITDKGRQSGKKCIELLMVFISSRWDWGGCHTFFFVVCVIQFSF